MLIERRRIATGPPSRRLRRCAALACAALAAGCAARRTIDLASFPPPDALGERTRVLELYPGVTATIVAPARIDASKRVDLVLYALPNGNTTAQTIGRRPAPGVDWHFDIQNIGAQTRALRRRGMPQAVVAYLEADSKSWPVWRARLGYARANARIVEIVDQVRAAIGSPAHTVVTLTGHSGGGSFMFGFIEGQDSLPAWLERIAFLDANYNFDWAHGEKLVRWLRGAPERRLVVLAYDDRNIMLDGKKVVSDSGGTWRASERMMNYLRVPFPFTADTLGEFRRFRARQMEVLLHPNRENRILHTVMIGEMNGYMHALLSGQVDYDAGPTLLKTERAYTAFVQEDTVLPAALLPELPTRPAHGLSGSAFIASLADRSREEREAAVRRELFAGNVPSFLRRLRTVTVKGTGLDSVAHVVQYDVMPDYLAIGSDDDFVRMPMVPYTAQDFCDAFGFVLPTRKMVNDIWAAAGTHLDPRPLTVEREAPATFLQHERIIEEQMKGAERGVFVAGIKKDVVVSNKLQEHAKRVAIYGWHYPAGQPIQPLYTGHIDWYVDYSHGFRPVRRWMRVDGVRRAYEDILKDPNLAFLLSDEGVIALPRYDRP